MKLARNKADYLLLMDCDMTVHPTINFDKTKLTYDAYDIRYLGDLDFAQQLFVSGGKVVIGYELNGNNLEGAFRKAEQSIKNHLETSFKFVNHLQNEIKKEKITSTINAPSSTEEHQS